MKTLDITQFGCQKISFYLALERYLLDSPQWRNEDLFFIWDIYPAIVCGKHQLIESEVNLENAAKIGVSVYRRHSGGGTIFADEGCFMFTFLKRSLARDHVFKSCLGDVVTAFKEIGLDASLSGRNDLIFKEKKFSGNAYYRNEFGSILHGTLLYKTDIEQMVRSITPDNEKLVSKGIESVRQRVINVGDYTDLNREELMRHLEHSIAPEAVSLTQQQYDEVCSIEPQYLCDEWMRGNNPPYTFINKIRMSFGLIEARVDVKKGIIQNIALSGDFFTHTDLEPLFKALVGVPFELYSVAEVLRVENVSLYILGATNDDLLKLLSLK